MKKLFIIINIILLLILGIPVYSKADSGPKPSITITIEGLDNEIYYATLLSKWRGSGPAKAHEGSIKENLGEADKIWKKFVEYKDTDGFYYLQEDWKCKGNDSFCWSYYPPTTFKILLYFPKTDTFLVSEICEKYAFDSYYTVNIKDYNSSSKGSIEEKPLEVRNSYNYVKELLGLIARIGITICIEIGIAILFGYAENKQLIFLSIVNVVTQTILNLILNIINYSEGIMFAYLAYIKVEFLVLIIETVVYFALLQKFSSGKIKKWLIIPYTLIANIASFVIGAIIANYIPQIF